MKHNFVLQEPVNHCDGGSILRRVLILCINIMATQFRMYWITFFSVRNYSQFDFFLPRECFCLSMCGPLGAPPGLRPWRWQRDAVWHQRVERDPELPTPLRGVSHSPILNERFLSADWLIWQEDHYDWHARYVHVYKRTLSNLVISYCMGLRKIKK